MILKISYYLSFLFLATEHLTECILREQGKLLGGKEPLPPSSSHTSPLSHSGHGFHNPLLLHFAVSIAPSQSFDSTGSTLPLTIHHLLSMDQFTCYPWTNPWALSFIHFHFLASCNSMSYEYNDILTNTLHTFAPVTALRSWQTPTPNEASTGFHHSLVPK